MSPMDPRSLRPKRAAAPTPTGTPASLLLRFDGDFADSSISPLTVTAIANAAISTETKKFGSGAAFLDGSDAWVVVESDESLNLTGEVPYTIEMWLYIASYANNYTTVFTRRFGSNWQYLIGFSDPATTEIFFSATAQGGGNSQCRSNAPLSIGEWHHIAAVVTDGVAKLFVDGVLRDTQPWATQPDNASQLWIGTSEAGGELFNGYLDDIRIVKGLAVYTGPFIPPTAPLSVYATPAPVQRAASLLLHFDGDFSDSSPSALTVTANGNAAISTTKNKYGTGSASAEGNGQYLTTSADAFNFGTGDFTIEWWQYIYAGLTSDAMQALWGNGRVAGIANGLCCYVQAQSYAFNKLVVDGMVGESWHSPMLVADSPFIPQQWQHCAVTRSGEVYRLWIDGVEQDSFINSGALEWPNAAPASILSVAGNSGEFSSSSVATYVDDFRVVPGLAVYTGPFIPPTAPLSVYATPAPQESTPPPPPPAITAPNAPTSVAGAAGNGQASLTWTAPASNGGAAITDYAVQFSSNSGSTWNTFADGTSTATSATVTGLTNGTAYTFRVAAVNSAGTGSYSSASSSVTPATTPGVPTGLTVAAVNSQAALSWTAPASNGGAAITDYAVQYSSNSGTTWNTFGTSTATSATVTGLTNGTTYTFRVAAVNIAGTGSYSAASSSVTPATTPGTPTSLAATAGNAQVALSWTAPASNGGAAITDYTVQFSSNSGSTWNTFADGTSTATSATVTGLTNGTAYTFRVAAVNSVGTGAYSSASSSVTPVSPGITAEYLVVAGGGAMPMDHIQGAGGAGGLLAGAMSLTAGTSYAVTVGAGGAAGTTYYNGANSQFASLTAIGGGRGGNNNNGFSGGSGGGGGQGGQPGAGTTGQGNAGGSGDCGGGSGGGAGGAGIAPYLGIDGDGDLACITTAGGSGYVSSITGASSEYARGGTRIFGGQNTTAMPGAGGSAGSYAGRNGVVIIAYQGSPLTSISAGLTYTVSTTSRSGYRVYTFTGGTGTITP